MKNEREIASKLESLGIKGTIIYLIVFFGGIPAAAFLGWIKLRPMSLNELGDLFAGAFGPLAIFWVVLGFLQQGRELRNSVSALEFQTKELRNSVEQQAKLAAINEKQFKDQLLARKEESRRLLEATLPFILLTSNGSSGGKTKTYRFKLTNRGGDARRIELSSSMYGVETNPRLISQLLSDDEIVVNITSERPLFEFEDGVLEVQSADKFNNLRVQKFRVCDPHCAEISNEIRPVQQA